MNGARLPFWFFFALVIAAEITWLIGRLLP